MCVRGVCINDEHIVQVNNGSVLFYNKINTCTYLQENIDHGCYIFKCLINSKENTMNRFR